MVPEPADPIFTPEPEPAAAPPHSPDDTAPIALGVVVLPPPPPPKPVIVPERAADGWRTPSLSLRPTGASGFYLAIDGHDQHNVIHLAQSQLEQLYALLDGNPGALWRKLCDIPLERPRPSRALEDELRVMLTAFAAEIRVRR